MRSRSSAYALSALGLLLSAVPMHADSPPLSLEACVEIGLTEHQSVRIAALHANLAVLVMACGLLGALFLRPEPKTVTP